MSRFCSWESLLYLLQIGLDSWSDLLETRATYVHSMVCYAASATVRSTRTPPT